MPTFTAEKMATWTGGHWVGSPGSPLSGFTADTRTLVAGQGFVALKTAQRDGHDFLAAAAARGAVAALVSQAVSGSSLAQLVVPDPLRALQRIAREHRREFNGTVIGVTGSVGKTSTKDLLGILLGGATHVLTTEGNLNNHLGVPLTLTKLDTT
ncbi:MAG: Mur ligase family protein, partial [Opitutaceae bacterium]